jgi:hypothetical protein
MPVMVQVTGFAQAFHALRLQELRGKREAASVSVGYTQHYAIHVHENLEAFHPVGQAKYLEEPARANAATYGRIGTQAYRNGATLPKALLVAGLALQRDSQKLVPVDTGALRASAFTALDEPEGGKGG